jgi:hypothetical protein
VTREEEELAFFHELGLAICNWSSVEVGIYQVMTALDDTKKDDAMGFGFFAVDNFRAKLAFANAFLNIKLPADSGHRKTWNGLVTRLEKSVRNRNRLAHDRIIVYLFGEPGRRYALERWPDPTPRKSKAWPATTPRDGALCLRDVVSCKSDFYYLVLELKNFDAALRGRKEPHPEVHAREARPPTIQAIKRQMHEALGHPLAPSRRKSSSHQP